MSEFPESRRGRPPKYPWEEWMNGTIQRRRKGEDFDCDIKSFQALVHRTAKERFHGKVDTRIVEDTLVFRFTSGE